jgi:subfamily B ATP-binding cassette protein MsbA
MNAPDSMQLYSRLLAQLRPYRTQFVLSLVATALIALVDPAIAALMKPMLDGTFIARDPYLMKVVPLALVGLFVVRGLASFASGVGMSWIGSRIVTNLRQQMFAKLLRLPTLFYDARTSGELISKFTYDSAQLIKATTQVLVTLVRDSLSVLGLVLLMLYLNWQLTLVIAVVAPAIAVIAALVSRRMRRLSHGMQDAMGSMTHTLDEAIGGERILKIYGAQGQEQRRFDRVANRVHHLLVKVRVASEAFSPMIQLITVIAIAAMVYLAAQAAATGTRTVGETVAFFGAMGMLLAPIKRLTRVNEALQAGLAACASLFGLLDREEEIDTGTHAPERVRGEIRLEGVTLRYPDGERPALDGIDLTVAPGEMVALVGPSGSGKSSLIKLLPRLYVPTAGRILLDGVDVGGYRLDALRTSFAYVGQESTLFNDTVAANIAYGLGDRVSRDAIVAAAEQAHAREFIDRLPQGFDTLIGEDGSQLSGGQRQRLAIARALLRDAPILLLDEATSALDSQAEAKVQAAIDIAKAGRTTLVVAHRLSTVIGADRIVVLQEGRVAEIGSHDALVAQGGLYAQMHALQAPTTGGRDALRADAPA